MNIAQIETNLQNMMKSFNPKTFIYDLLLAYGLPKASITRLQKGNLNLSKVEGELSWKKKLLFKEEFNNDLHIAISDLAAHAKHDQRFIITTDYKLLLAIDTKTLDKLDIDLADLPKHFDFFLPWVGMKKAQHANENPADVKAAERMAKLFDEIKKDNPDNSPEFIHGLNVFLSRLLFCFFAEDTNIFQNGQFTNAIHSHTQTNGSDLNTYLDHLFEVLNTPEKLRVNLPDYLHHLPYVNGGLFRKRFPAPLFTRRSRQVIIESGELNWSAINPDIFGSMIQAVVSPEHRGGLGMHYTSVPNIMKVIEPLFLNDLYEAFEKAKGNPKKLNELLHRLSNLKIFDPDCGSGNFLIIAYKELRKLEIKIIHHLQELQQAASGFNPKSEQLSIIPKAQLSLAASFQVELFSRIQLSQFYGIEIDDFAHEVAQLSLWLAEHQMNTEFFKEFGQTNPTLPLKEAGNIVQGNACRVDWETVCPKTNISNAEPAEVYILGNPPYLGSSMQDKEQKSDMKYVFGEMENFKKQDYISSWLYKSAKYITKNIKSAFVSTNSICQGTQVEMTWPHIFNMGIEVFFTHKDFVWSNSAKNKAGVICSIIGLREKNNEPKYIFNNGMQSKVGNINAYLVNARNTIVYKRSKPLSSLMKMTSGNKPLDGGNLVLSTEEKEQLVRSFPASEVFIRKFIGSSDYINGDERWCLWLNDDNVQEAIEIPEIKGRVEKVKSFRMVGGNNAKAKALTPHKFEFSNEPEKSQVIVPRVSSIRREYIPMGFVEINTVIADSSQVIYDAEPYVFGLLNSKMHMTWVRVTAGRLKSDYRYSSYFSYHTFPFPPISDQRKQEITQCVFRILEEREKHPEKTLAQLYDPDKMPTGLREAHHQNDLAIERCYRTKPFESDEERLEYLFKLYEQMIEEEKNKGSLFAKEKKNNKKGKLCNRSKTY